MTTSIHLLDQLLARTRTSLGALQPPRPHLVAALDRLAARQRPALLTMVEEAFAWHFERQAKAIPPMGRLKGRFDPLRLNRLLPVFHKLRSNTVTKRPLVLYPVAGETVLGTDTNVLRLGELQVYKEMGIKKGALGSGGKVTLDTLKMLKREGVHLTDRAYYTEYIDPKLDLAVTVAVPQVLDLPQGSAAYIEAATYVEDSARPYLMAGYWTTLAPKVARRLFPRLPPGYDGMVFGSDGHRLHAVAMPGAPKVSLVAEKYRRVQDPFIPISPLALADSDVINIYTWTHKTGGDPVEAIAVTPNTLSRMEAGTSYPPNIGQLILDLTRCEPPGECPSARCRSFDPKAFKAALKALQAKAKDLSLIKSPYQLCFEGGMALLAAYGRRQGEQAATRLREVELEGWEVDESIKRKFNASYALDAFKGLGSSLELTFRKDDREPAIVTSLDHPMKAALLMAVRGE